jgi:hypothetical protein
MHLAADYVHPTPRGGRCRIRIYLPAEPERDAPVVICTVLPSNEGQSVTNAVKQLGAEVIRGHRLPTPLVWIEHYPPESTNRETETFDLVIFSTYEITERAPYLGESRITIGTPARKPIDCASVETLIGSALH